MTLTGGAVTLSGALTATGAITSGAAVNIPAGSKVNLEGAAGDSFLVRSGADDAKLSIDGTDYIRCNAGAVTLTGALVTTGVIKAPDGSGAAPSYTFGSTTNAGIALVSANTLGLCAAGASRWQVTSGALRTTSDGSAASPVLGRTNDGDTGFFWNAGGSGDTLSMAAGGVEALRVDASAVAGNTRLLIYDVSNATLERVTVGAADSGGAGFKVLRIPN